MTVVVVVGGVVVVGTCVVVVVVAAVVVVVVGTTVDVVVAAVVVVVSTAVAHDGTEIVLSSRVTAPLRARTRPLTWAPVSSVIEVRAMKVPAVWLVVPRVTELPTCQKTLQACAPFSNTT